jgi:short subunit dehydrogenase-like uncharacterized protein
MREREYDVVLYGASGYTGRQTVEYFTRHAPAGGFRWAIAGHDRDRLERVRREANVPLGPADVLVADAHDRAALDAIASRARVVLSTAGPFVRFGTPLVDACVRFRTHYADITGETTWVRGLIAHHHERAAADGTRIVPCSGFDSVPSDLGTLLVQRRLREALGVPCVEVRAYYRFAGGLNGGTAATLLHTIETGQAGLAADPFLLDSPAPHDPRQLARSRDVRAPRYDRELGAWVGPFVTATTDTRVVRRSVALCAEWGEPYGPAFVFQEFARCDPPLAAAKAGALGVGLAAFYGALRWRPTRVLLERYILPRPGTGPSRGRMERGWFTCDLLGFAADGRRVRGWIRHRGDPSNVATVRFACESALALALETEALPGGPRRGGVLTPATALGEVLIERLRRTGVAIGIDLDASGGG